MRVVSVAGLALNLRAFYGPNAMLATGVTPVASDLLVPGWLAQNAFNLVVGLPIRCGLLSGLLL